MNDATIRQIIREELAAFFAPGQEAVRLDAEQMARLIVSGRGAEVKERQRLLCGDRRTVRRAA